MPRKTDGLIAVVISLVFWAFCPSPASALPVPEGGGKQSLNGTWRLAVVGPGAVAGYKNFQRENFDESGMKDIDVPSNWELRGFEPASYYDPSRSVGFYRRKFHAPDFTAGGRVMLHFEGVLYGAEVWLNGVRLGRHLGGFTGFEFDATEAVRPGRENLLAVKVTKATTPAYGYDCSDAWALSGIYRDVYLYQVPAVHLAEVIIVTDLDASYRDAVLRVNASVRNSGPAPAAVAVSITLADPSGVPVGSRSAQAELGPGASRWLPLEFEVSNPAKWSAESPALYRLTVKVEADGINSTTWHEVGFREVEVKNGRLLLNGVPIKLRGVNRHETSIDNGRALTRAEMERDLDLMRAANINTVRTSHYPPDPEFLKLCDRRGFYVIDEAPFNFHEELLYMPWMLPLLRDRVSETIARDRNHPGVIIWSLGNENPWSPSHPTAVKLARALDPTRPVTIPQTGYRNGDIRGNLPPEVEVLSPHYPDPAQLRRIIDHQKKLTVPRPIVMTEFLHSLGRHYWTREIWEVVWSEPLAAGGCVWDWADQGIRRPIDGGRVYEIGEFIPDLPEALIRYASDDDNYIIDAHGIYGTDGLVNADRSPQPEYYEIRKIYSPIHLITDRLEVTPGQSGLAVAVQNRFDFTGLNSSRLAWRLLADGRELGSGAMSYPAAAPHESAAVTVPATLPERLIAGVAYQLEVDSFDPGGTMIDTHVIELEPKPGAAVPCGPAAGASLSVTEAGNRLSVGNQNFSVVFDQATGDIVRLSAGGRETEVVGPALNVWRPLQLVETAQPSYSLYGVKGEDPGSGSSWFKLGIGKVPVPGSYGLLADLQAMSLSTSTLVVESRAADGVVVVSESEFVVPRRGSFGFSRRYLIGGDGVVAVEYEVRPAIGEARLLELGVRFDLPPAYDGLEWFGVGPDAYPGTIRNSRVSLNAAGACSASAPEFSTNKTDVRWAIIKGGALPIGFEGRGGFLGNLRADRGRSTSVFINPWVKQPGKKHRDPGTDLEVPVSPGQAFRGRFEIRPGLTREQIQDRQTCGGR